MPQHPQTPSRHDNPTSIDDLLTHAEQTVRDMTLRDPLPAPSPPARDARLRYDTPRHHEAHLRLREHLAAWPALADATHRLLIDLDRRDDAPHLLLTALTSLQHLPQLDAPEPYLVRATTLLHAAADLAHGRDTPAAAISERTGHICGRALAMLDTAVHATQTLGAESTRPNRKNQLLARPTTPELRALRTLTQLRTQIADISPYYGRADHAGIDALAVDAHSPGLAGDLRRWHDSAIAQLTARDTPSLRLPAGDLTMITVASARLVDIAAAAGIITAQTATPASTALRAAATAWNDAGLAWPHLPPIAGQRIPTLLQTHHRLGQQLHRRFTDIANPDGIYQQDLNPAAAAPGWLAATLHAAPLLRDVSARYVQAAETIINAGAMPIRADHLMANLRHTAAYAGADSITVATPTPADIRRRRWLTAAGHATTAARTGPSL